MKTAPTWLGTGALGAGLALAGVAGCSSGSSSAVAPATSASSAAKTSAPAAPSAAAPSPTVTRTVIKTVQAAPPASATSAPAAAPPASPPQPSVVPNVTDPWAVVSAYYGDVESGDYQQAYALLSSGMTTGQSYQQFVAGYACTGGQEVSENWESGDQVNFDLTAYDNCSGAEQYYTGTDTVENGQVVAASIVQNG
jgi:hypothetical protein